MSPKYCAMFAGQSVQSQGMCRELWKIPAAREVLERLKPSLGDDLEHITVEMPNPELAKTFNAQRAIHAHHLGNWHAYLAKNPQTELCGAVGHSMGVVAALVAAGAAGLHVVQLSPEIKMLAEYATDGFAMDVKVLGDKVYVAEGKGGMSIWRRKGDASLELLGRYEVKGQSIKQVVVPAPGRYALLHVGPSALHIVDVSDPAHPKLALKDSRLGLLYGYQITDGLLDGRYASCFWHVTGFYWYDLYGGPAPVYTGDNYAQRMSGENGTALIGKNMLVTYGGKYFLLSPKETRPPEALPKFGIEGRNLDGKPSVFGTTLYVSNRYWGRVSRVDISSLEAPKLLDAVDLDGNPGVVLEHNGKMIIPAGYQGLLVER